MTLTSKRIDTNKRSIHNNLRHSDLTHRSISAGTAVALWSRGPLNHPAGERDHVFKLTTVITGDRHATLTLEGRLTGEWVEELAKATQAAMANATHVTLELRGLTFVDARGVARLRDAAERGAVLAGGSTFVAALIADGKSS
jgi:ABC-type transporter Mla MlaB component